MPELPEVETVRRGLHHLITGFRITAAHDLHPRALKPESIAPLHTLNGAKITGTNRRGKFMWITLNRPYVLVAHLGMSGQFKIQKVGAEQEAHLRANFTLSNGREMRFIDQRTFGWLAVDQLVAGIPTMVSHIARDPFDPDFNKREIVKEISTKRGQIKKVILDQEVISGIGNIYADEALWRAGIHPETIASELSSTQILNLITAATKVMQRALVAGGTSFDELYINVNGESGYFERSLAVYGREGEACRRRPRCRAKIIRIAFANRSSRLCPACQTR